MDRLRSTLHGTWRRWTANGEAMTPLKGCAWPGCDEVGDYRAPRSPRSLREYLWFCLDHVRQYNKEWDYFAGMDASAIEQVRRGDAVWHRPTWPLGVRPDRGAEAQAGPKPHDPFGLFGDAGGAAETTPPKTPRDEALAALGLDRTVTRAEVKTRYKQLVKRHHPDANGGCKKSEERLKTINEAYTYLVSREPA